METAPHDRDVPGIPDVSGAPSELGALGAQYELIRELGHGGMAAVYLARERGGGRLVAVKLIRGQYLENEEAVSRFAREAHTVAALDHPNIVHTYRVEQVSARALVLVMQYVPGDTVRDALRRDGPFPYERAERVLRDVAEALRYAHGRGIVHRDVKPENIFLDAESGRAVLSDFGIARPMDSDTQLTLVGSAIGTPSYMSPEQIDGRGVDGRSDLYSLGLLGWEMLTGQRPWAGEGIYSVIYKQKHEELPRLTTLRADIPAPLLYAIEGALHKHPDTRWASADEFLAQLLEENPTPPPPPSTPPPRAEETETVRFRRPVDWRELVAAPPVPRASGASGASRAPRPPRRLARVRTTLMIALPLLFLLGALAVGEAGWLRHRGERALAPDTLSRMTSARVLASDSDAAPTG
ncbi:MAG: serine/threonine-protein kinase, partial [Gemmatimonadaceae bacterium]